MKHRIRRNVISHSNFQLKVGIDFGGNERVVE